MKTISKIIFLISLITLTSCSKNSYKVECDSGFSTRLVDWAYVNYESALITWHSDSTTEKYRLVSEGEICQRLSKTR